MGIEDFKVVDIPEEDLQLIVQALSAYIQNYPKGTDKSGMIALLEEAWSWYDGARKRNEAQRPSVRGSARQPQ